MGVDYQVYMCVALLRHMEHEILLHQQHQDLIIYLRVCTTTCLDLQSL